MLHLTLTKNNIFFWNHYKLFMNIIYIKSYVNLWQQQNEEPVVHNCFSTH